MGGDEEQAHRDEPRGLYGSDPVHRLCSEEGHGSMSRDDGGIDGVWRICTDPKCRMKGDYAGALTTNCWSCGAPTVLSEAETRGES